MAETTEIAWCDSTFNPWIGCTKVGPGCDNCYAKADFEDRKHRVIWGAGQARSRTAPANWAKPLQWNKQPFCECMNCHWRGEKREASLQTDVPGTESGSGAWSVCPACGQPMLKEARRRVFCASLADVFDNEVSAQWRFDLLKLIEQTPNLDWLLLTKRIGNAAPMLEQAVRAINCGRCGWADNVFPNVWIGATIINQEEADRDIPKLLDVPAAVRFLSMEPLLGPVDLRQIGADKPMVIDALRGEMRSTAPISIDPSPVEKFKPLDWVIVGGESGSKARPMHPDWVRDLRDQCEASSVPFLFKQWGEWAPGECASNTLEMRNVQIATWFGDEWAVNTIAGSSEFHRDDEPELYRAGKKASGRLLDSVQHDGFPAVK